MTPRDRRQKYAGKRVAGRTAAELAALTETGEPTEPTEAVADLADRTPTPQPVPLVAPRAERPAEPDPVVVFEVEAAAYDFGDLDSTEVLPLAHAAPGKRKAVKHAGSRGPLFKGLPSPPVLVGVAVLAVSIGGALVTTDAPQLTGGQPAARVHHASALNGSGGVGSVSALSDRDRPISRDSQRDALREASGGDLKAAAEKQAEQRDAALGQLAQAAEQQAARIAENRWVLPLSSISVTAEYGEYGLWSSYHTGIDFNGDTGDSIMAIASGVVTSAGYDGAYGNKTVVTLEDGTEIWYCHQNAFGVSEGDTVTAGEVIGEVGTTGNVTGSHLHLEVRPGGGDPVDPRAAFAVHGVDL